MAPRGLSADDKRVKMLELFHETKDFYQLKELEKLGPKMKGIVAQSVKEVVQDLVDDNLVQTDKIGSGNFFWSFPSQEGAAIVARMDEVKKDIKRLTARGEEVEELLEKERETRPPSDERSEALKHLRDLRHEKDKLVREKSSLLQCDAAQVEHKKRGGILAKEAAERWTENVLAVLQYLESQGQDASSIRKAFGIREGWEDIL
ncbi:meiotic nuclear division protein 1 [Calocera viscosa TUFC12733]|uniref:Meiotic nuclear division protein 1 n=1 Tax=Calocera viscosa (strain TUFC12733) TaxID=1330018 RepID=A0A167G8T6_CALVF|nr:meiotic nuclear division protein 1 [Calocera viscosa TUFC12733]